MCACVLTRSTVCITQKHSTFSEAEGMARSHLSAVCRMYLCWCRESMHLCSRSAMSLRRAAFVMPFGVEEVLSAWARASLLA